jgi:hypothetical protein
VTFQIDWTRARNYVRLLHAVQRDCPTYQACQQLKQPLPPGGCSCPAHQIFSDAQMVERLYCARARADQLREQEFREPPTSQQQAA